MRAQTETDEWLTRARDALAEAAQMPAAELALTRQQIDTLLDLAAIAAHESGDRTNAPLLCYLIGRAQGVTDLASLATVVRQRLNPA